MLINRNELNLLIERKCTNGVLEAYLYMQIKMFSSDKQTNKIVANF